MFEPLKKTSLEEQHRTTAALTRRSPSGGSSEIAGQWRGALLKSIRGTQRVASGVKGSARTTPEGPTCTGQGRTWLLGAFGLCEMC